jgi:mannose-6-phosphate isomerase
MELLQPVVRPYPWGSRRGIAELQGRPVPAAGPEAELWMGAHPSGPSGLARRADKLDAFIAADPERELGPQVVARFGPRLPFLLKVLSAAQALSIQVHPSREQAQAGFRADNDRGLALDDPARNYVDDWPKPELLCALTPFEVVAGLRTPADAAGILRALAVPELQPLAADLAPSAPASAAPGVEPAPAAQEAEPAPADLARVLGVILDWPDPDRLVSDVLAACGPLAAGTGPYAETCASALRVADDHPGDLGLVAMLLMRHLVLQPGQALFMPAGGLHAYLEGTGIEVLANSDNVVRAGLTPKHIDVPELLKLLDPAVTVPILSSCAVAEGLSSYDSPAPEFRLYRLDLAATPLELPGTGPRILLCVDGAVALHSDSGSVFLDQGESCFISAADAPVRAAGPAHAFLAAPDLGRYHGKRPSAVGGRVAVRF